MQLCTSMDICYGLHLKNPAISLLKPLLLSNLRDQEKHETSSWQGRSSPLCQTKMTRDPRVHEDESGKDNRETPSKYDLQIVGVPNLYWCPLRITLRTNISPFFPKTCWI